MSKLFKQFLSAGAAMLMLAAIPMSVSAAAERFTDVKPEAWYYKAVDYVVTEKLFSGTSTTTFNPSGAMTRGMFVRVLGNMAGKKLDGYQYSSFSDVQVGKWYAPYVEWAAANRIVDGIGGGKFAPDQSITREQMAVILYNYARYAGCDQLSREGALAKFSDSDTISEYAWHAMEWAVTHDILSGSGGKLNPQGTATRAQVAQILYTGRELLKNSANDDSKPDDDDFIVRDPEPDELPPTVIVPGGESEPVPTPPVSNKSDEDDFYIDREPMPEKFPPTIIVPGKK